MRVSNKLFNEQQVRAFQSMRSDMQGIQEKIASGNKINRASDDPMGAVNSQKIQIWQICGSTSVTRPLMK